MKAWVIDNFEGIEKARVTDVPDPKPGAGEVVLKLKFAALNPADAYLAKGEYPSKPPLPHILGRDGIGEVVAVGPDVKDVHVGEKKAILRGDTGVYRWGTFAQFVSVAAQSLVDVTRGWTDQQAASATLVYLTAYQAITQWDDLPAQSVILISGASGGVGVAATQLGAAMGHTIIGLSRDPQKREQLKSQGMTHGFDSNDPQWRKTLMQFLVDQKVNLVIDNIGGSLFPELIATLGNHGRVSVVGRLAGPVPQFNTSSLFFRRLRIGGVAVGAYTNQEAHAAWKQVIELLKKAESRPLIDHVFPFDQLPEAFARLAKGPMGKVLISIPQ